MSIINPDITRTDPALCDALRQIGSATAAGKLYNLVSPIHIWRG